MSKYLQISGLIGIVLTAFGLIAFAFTGELNWYVWVHVGLGIVCLIVYAVTQGGKLVGSLHRRSARYGLHAALYSLLLIAVLILANFLSTRYRYRWDLTESKVFSLSPQTVKVLGQLNQDFQIYGFFEKGENPQVADLIKSYTYVSPRVKFTAVDPERHPEMAKQYKIQQMNTLHVSYGQESTNITDASEETVTNAIIKLTKGTKKNVLFLTGHGEPKLDDRETPQGYAAAKAALENENYQVKEILLSTREKVPPETSLLIIAAPEKPLLEHEVAAIENYLKGGGRILILLPAPEGDSLKNFLRGWGAEVGDDIVVDQVIKLFAGPTLGVEPIAEIFNVAHPITREFKERTIFPLVRSVEPVRTDGLEATWLVQTSTTSWAEKDVNGIFKQGRAALGPEDKKGPISVAVAVSANLKALGAEKDGEAKLVVVGTAGFANNRYLNIYFNRDFFLNAANWLIGQEEMISIRARSVRSSRLQLTEGEAAAIFYFSFLILPEILLIIGLAVWWRRR
ncbi:MAG TPA: GldG family protein [Candidatus Binatia bacterium]|jgi:ABC-type uncharacterized transport system involved in gliding motility auxiliary subunit